MVSLRHWLFVGSILLLSAVAWLTVWSQLILPMELPEILQSLLGYFFIVSYFTQILLLLNMHAKNPPALFILIAFFFMGFFLHLFFAALIKTILILIPFLTLHEKVLSYLFTLSAIALNFWGIRTACVGPEVKKVLIPLPVNQTDLNGYKIIQISDLHIGPLLGKKYIQKIVRIANQLSPDAAVLTGDIGDSSAEFFGKELMPLRDLNTKDGLFYITGNHEYYWGVEKWIEALRSSGAKPLINEGAAINHGKIWLGGVPDISAPRFVAAHVSDPIQALKGNPSSQTYKILLAHQPKSCFLAEKAGYNLMLSGHTHGGQFFPINLLVGFFNPYSKGLNRHENMWVYVNRGTGFWGPVLRLGVPAEITLIEFSAKVGSDLIGKT